MKIASRCMMSKMPARENAHRVECPGCGKDVTVTSRGMIRAHYGPARDLPVPVPEPSEGETDE